MRTLGMIIVVWSLATRVMAATPEEQAKWQQIVDGWRANQAAIKTLHVEYDATTAFPPAPAGENSENIKQNRYIVVHDQAGDRFLQDCTIWSDLAPDLMKAEVAPRFRKTQRIVASDGQRCFTREKELKTLIISDQPDRRMPSIPEPGKLLPYGSVDVHLRMMEQGLIELTSVTDAKEGAVQALQVELRAPKTGYRVVVWYVPKQGYLPIHVQQYGPGDKLTGEQSLTQIYDDPDGKFHYPLAGAIKLFEGGKEIAGTSMTVNPKTLRINQPMAVSFSLTPESGERIWDVDHMRELKELPPPATRPTTRP